MNYAQLFKKLILINSNQSGVDDRLPLPRLKTLAQTGKKRGIWIQQNVPRLNVLAIGAICAFVELNQFIWNEKDI